MAAAEGAAAPSWLDRFLRPGRNSRRDVTIDLLWLAGLGLLFIGAGLGLRDPWPPDEPRFALVAQDMLRSGDWLFPRIGGDLYADKPPLFFWLIAVATRLTGSLRIGFLLPSLLSGLGTVLLTYDLLRRSRGREAGLAGAFGLLLTFQFVWQARMAQIDATLCFFTTLSLYGLLRHLCLGPARGWFLLGWAAAGLGVITKGVGFLPLLVLVPFVVLAKRDWPAASKRIGSLGLAGLASMVIAIGLWFVPMIVATSAGGDLLAYRNEILFHQTVTRYAEAWHHHAPIYYYFVEIIPIFWLPLIAISPWLWPRWREAYRGRDTLTILLLAWVLIVVLFFTSSTGKRTLYILPAVPAFAMAAGPWMPELLRARGPRRVAFALACAITVVAALAAAYLGFSPRRAAHFIKAYGISPVAPLAVVAVCAAAWLVIFRFRDAWLAYAGVLGTVLVFTGLYLYPQMDAERSGRAFIAQVQRASAAYAELALVGAKEQYLLQIRRPSFNFGHARWRERESEAADAAAWLAEDPRRALVLERRTRELCFKDAPAVDLGKANNQHWFLVTGTPDSGCAARGDRSRARLYTPPDVSLNTEG
ncbi:MAG: glycosyltransferase family 39 protein [Gammaproteobacteria bacterium]|nr:glycosyltransferase family 39 protein [Gammaproteobacteria bacterium]